MGFTSCTGVTFCRTGGFTFFLDIRRDRYFAIGGEADAAFSRLVSGHTSHIGDDALIAKLVRDSLVVETPGLETPKACGYVCTAHDSAIDIADSDPQRLPIIGALARIVTAKWSLKRFGLSTTLQALEVRKKRKALRFGSAAELARIAGSFERCNAVSSPLDQCLPRSIAAAHRMIDVELSPILLMGVRAQPFAAHCWVESDGFIVNDRHDTVRTFAPILVL